MDAYKPHQPEGKRMTSQANELADVASFLARYRAFALARRVETVTDFQTRFERIRDAFKQKKAAVQERARRFAPDFNVFHLLGVAADERHTHSALLAELLNPGGSHGQGHHFLQHFLSYCKQRFGGSEFDVEGTGKTEWIVRTERITSSGRLDILLTNPERAYCT